MSLISIFYSTLESICMKAERNNQISKLIDIVDSWIPTFLGSYTCYTHFVVQYGWITNYIKGYTMRFKMSGQTWHRYPYSKSYDPVNQALTVLWDTLYYFTLSVNWLFIRCQNLSEIKLAWLKVVWLKLLQIWHLNLINIIDYFAKFLVEQWTPLISSAARLCCTFALYHNLQWINY